jgi:hypothetical protein
MRDVCAVAFSSRATVPWFVRAVSMATGYGLDDGGVGVRVPVRPRPAPWVQSASYPMGPGVIPR